MNVFLANVDVSRLSHDEGGPIDGYSACITIKCSQCDLPFSFLGDYPAGVHYLNPMVNIDATELRAPIGPGPQPLQGKVTYTLAPRRKS